MNLSNVCLVLRVHLEYIMARKENDFYPTPAQLTKELLKRVEISGTVFECCAGKSDISKELTLDNRITDVTTNDINYVLDVDYSEDASKQSSWDYYDWLRDWIITNPPFTKAPEIIPLAWDNCIVGIAMLLRLSYLEPAKNRGTWLQEHSQYLTDLIIFGQPRPSFTSDGKVDTATTAWFVWQKKPKLVGTQLHFVTNWKQ